MKKSTLVLATRNSGKIQEIKAMIADLPFEVWSIQDFPGCPESEEPYDSYQENALDKAKVVGDFCQTWVLADDSGLEIDALDGAPGVLSARYAGPRATYQDNCEKVLREMADVPIDRRQAQFYCCMVLYHPSGKRFQSLGTLPGLINTTAMGQKGFGYDPIFFLPEQNRTLAQLSLAEKNRISHRTKALQDMLEHLRSISETNQIPARS